MMWGWLVRSALGMEAEAGPWLSYEANRGHSALPTPPTLTPISKAAPNGGCRPRHALNLHFSAPRLGGS